MRHFIQTRSIFTLLILSLCLTPLVNAANLININTANISTLSENLSGIGYKKAAAIMEFRQKNGAFKNINDLTNVKGIGPKILEKNRKNITVGQTNHKKPANNTNTNKRTNINIDKRTNTNIDEKININIDKKINTNIDEKINIK